MMMGAHATGDDQRPGAVPPDRGFGGRARLHPPGRQYQVGLRHLGRVQRGHHRAAGQHDHLADRHERCLASPDRPWRARRGTAARAAALSRIGSLVRHPPSNARSAPATAEAVGTSPISPTPLAP